MKSLNVVFGLLMLVSFLSNAWAQDTTALKNKYQSHPWSLEFSISENFTLSSFQGSLASLSKYISDNRKIRLGVSGALSSQKNETEYYYYHGDTLTKTIPTSSSNINNLLTLTLQYLMYTTPYEDVSIYFGIGPTGSIAWSRDYASYNNKQYIFGIIGSCGVEYFVSSRLSFHAEYGLLAAYYLYKNEAIDYRNRIVSSRTYSSWNLSGQRVLLGLSVHF